MHPVSLRILIPALSIKCHLQFMQTVSSVPSSPSAAQTAASAACVSNKFQLTTGMGFCKQQPHTRTDIGTYKATHSSLARELRHSDADRTQGLFRSVQAATAVASLAQEYIQRGGQLDPPQTILRKLFERLSAAYMKLGQFIASSLLLFSEGA
eukprot:GHRR01027182.1.p1 GENE.GHRR01027182.1~~GHRR01027182.1.p1  ORF type:complete len:153 (-),score=10.86 GHRR01027182.1:420-878(-)